MIGEQVTGSDKVPSGRKEEKTGEKRVSHVSSVTDIKEEVCFSFWK